MYYNEIEPYAAKWLENLSDAGHIVSGQVDTRSIVDVQPDEVGEGQAHFFAGIGAWSLALRMAGIPDEFPVWTGSCPCFPAGTLVLTDKGQRPIEEIAVGDFVLTHNNRFRRVTAVGSERNRECVVVRGQGHFGITCTPNHPFLVKEREWVASRDLKGRRWACVSQFPTQVIPDFARPGISFVDNAWRATGSKNNKTVYLGRFEHLALAEAARKQAIKEGRIDTKGATRVDVMSTSFARFLGYWVGNGWTLERQNKVFLCGGHSDGQLLEDIVADAGMTSRSYKVKTGYKIAIGSKELTRWLREWFGAGAANKTIPAWLHGAPAEYREAFLKGYLEADGSYEKNGVSFSTVSKKLAIGVRILLNQQGMSASIRLNKTPDKTTIEGREVNQRDYYRICAYDRKQSFTFEDQIGWGLVRSVEKTDNQTVFNLAVEEDETYVADGLIVHNCQPFSVAGKQKGEKDERHLWPEWRRLIAECLPPVLFGEQVGSPAGRDWMSAVRSDLEELGYVVGAADLCAAGVGSPHIRQRLFFGAIRLADSRLKGLERHAWNGGEHDKQGWINPSSARPTTATSGNHGMGDSNIERCERIDVLLQSRGQNEDGPEAAGDGGIARIEEPFDGVYSIRSVGDDVDWLLCRDPSGVPKWRPVRSGTFPMAYGTPNRVGRLRAYGNTIVPQVAAHFIKAFMEAAYGN